MKRSAKRSTAVNIALGMGSILDILPASLGRWRLSSRLPTRPPVTGQHLIRDPFRADQQALAADSAKVAGDFWAALGQVHAECRAGGPYGS